MQTHIYGKADNTSPLKGTTDVRHTTLSTIYESVITEKIHIKAFEMEKNCEINIKSVENKATSDMRLLAYCRVKDLNIYRLCPKA